MGSPDQDLAAAYVYATWVNTGAIECTETGGHHRPNHHAGLALQMFRCVCCVCVYVCVRESERE